VLTGKGGPTVRLTLLQHLPGVRFPAEKEQVATTAENNGAPQEVVQRIRNASRRRF
jgi:hypothetical protein